MPASVSEHLRAAVESCAIRLVAAGRERVMGALMPRRPPGRDPRRHPGRAGPVRKHILRIDGRGRITLGVLADHVGRELLAILDEPGRVRLREEHLFENNAADGLL
jgi:hypothetical protein